MAAFAPWHERHAAAREIVDGHARLIEHCAVEVYSVLTRLPAPHRVPAEVARDFLATCFRRPLLRLSARAHRDFRLGLPEHGVSGGAVYDALVAATAADAGAELVTCDRRAQPVYERYAVRLVII